MGGRQDLEQPGGAARAIHGPRFPVRFPPDDAVGAPYSGRACLPEVVLDDLVQRRCVEREDGCEQSQDACLPRWVPPARSRRAGVERHPEERAECRRSKVALRERESWPPWRKSPVVSRSRNVIPSPRPMWRRSPRHAHRSWSRLASPRQAMREPFRRWRSPPRLRLGGQRPPPSREQAGCG